MIPDTLSTAIGRSPAFTHIAVVRRTDCEVIMVEAEHHGDRIAR